MKTRVQITFKSGILDPQGQTIKQALASLGFTGVTDVRAGKYFEIELATEDPAEAREQVSKMCDRLLANPTIEHYQIDIDEHHPVSRD
jgi:phosphoribosylformylglycinamidine synthase subunit PurS